MYRAWYTLKNDFRFESKYTLIFTLLNESPFIQQLFYSVGVGHSPYCHGT